MTLSNIILSPLSGAVIGYFTNWLAIKMLFRPHREVRVLGIKMPFTPGLIPKERLRLADKVSEVISKHLLTKEALAESFSKPEIMEKIKDGIKNFLCALSKDERTLAEILNGSEFFASGLEVLERKLEEITESFINSRDFEAMLSKWAEGLTGRIEGETRTFREIIPADWASSVKSQVGKNATQVAELICGFLENNSSLDEALKEALGNVIANNLGGFVNLFVNKEKVYANIKESLLEYLRNPEKQVDLVFKITSMMEKALDTNVSELYAKIPDTVKDGAINKTIGFAQLELGGFLGKADYFKKKLLEIKIGVLVSKIPDGKLENAAAYLADIAGKLIQKGALYAAEAIDVAKLTKDQINALDLAESEEIVISVAKRELNAITYLGGVLGFIIGIIPVLTELFIG
ncbi:MAG: DUF445 family protein [Clostridiales bacterium]|jgi:uncharacterized membrane protein YheB (UPF0754 family)|nr:DUF445 family protein [Clostridiales bacterium]